MLLENETLPLGQLDILLHAKCHVQASVLWSLLEMQRIFFTPQGFVRSIPGPPEAKSQTSWVTVLDNLGSMSWTCQRSKWISPLQQKKRTQRKKLGLRKKAAYALDQFSIKAPFLQLYVDLNSPIVTKVQQKCG